METGVRFIGLMLVIFSWIFYPIFWWRSLRKPLQIPPIKDNLLFLSATSLAARIRQKQISSTQVVSAYIKRIVEINCIINAVVEERFCQALNEAKVVDIFLSRTSATLEELEVSKPLLGVPFTVKECLSLKGLSHSVGSLTRKHVKAGRDGASVRALKKAGGIPLLVSNTPELCLSWETNNLITGQTSNPYNTNFSCGGSSGGEGALIGAGASVIGLASDIAGSIRVPAMFNGVFGHKPTPGLISIKGHYPYSTDPLFSKFLVVGPIVRYAVDLKLMMNILTKGSKHLIDFNRELNLKEITIFYMENMGKSLVILPVQDEIINGIRQAIKHLEIECNCSVNHFQFKEMENSCEMSASMFFNLKNIPNILENPQNPGEQANLYWELIKSVFNLSNYSKYALLYYLIARFNLLIPRYKYGKYERETAELKRTFIETLGDSGVLIYPTFPTSAFLHGEIVLKSSGVIYTKIFNVLGFPSTHVPIGLDKKGLPIGFQVVAAPYKDHLCLAIAEELERHFGGWTKPNSN